MIIRETLACETCRHVHTVRIGMGQEEYQTHQFVCRGCKLPIRFGLKVDYITISTEIVFEENATRAGRDDVGTIVNLDANFLIPESEQGKDMSFARLEQYHQLVIERLAKLGGISEDDLHHMAGQTGRPDYAAEWRLLRQTWVLFRNKQEKLVAKRIAEANRDRYAQEHLSGVPDWLWRFASKLSGPEYDHRFKEVMKLVDGLGSKAEFVDFLTYYQKEVAGRRGQLYLDVFTEFFRAYDEFAQVHFLVSGGMDIPNDHHPASVHFEITRMFYGNAFESLATIADVLAMINNMSEGRAFNQFKTIALTNYLRLDKGGRFHCLADNQILSGVVAEADNHLRNASHHRSIEFNEPAGTLTYRTGKSGLGADQTISYGDYLARCSRIFSEILIVLRLELVLHQLSDQPPPL